MEPALWEWLLWILPTFPALDERCDLKICLQPVAEPCVCGRELVEAEDDPLCSMDPGLGVLGWEEPLVTDRDMPRCRDRERLGGTRFNWSTLRTVVVLKASEA